MVGPADGVDPRLPQGDGEVSPGGEREGDAGPHVAFQTAARAAELLDDREGNEVDPAPGDGADRTREP